MTTPVLCLLGFAMWALFLVGAVFTWRSVLVLRGEVPANGFKSGEEHGTPRYWRLNRAHANTVENLPIFGAVVLAAQVAEVSATILGPLALTVLTARIGQSAVHILGGSAAAVQARFSLYVVQWIAMLWMAVVTARGL
jgi:uncharacterized MAPEG superfamily protein